MNLENEKNRIAAVIIMGGNEEIELELYPNIAPNTVSNFVALAEEGSYDNLEFMRIEKDFVIQGGSPTNVIECEMAFGIDGEFSENGFDNPIKHVRGVISMARNSDYNSASTQYFIMHGDAPRLDGHYAAFGRVVNGMDVIDRIACASAVTAVSKSGREYHAPVEAEIVKRIIISREGYDKLVPPRRNYMK